MGHAVLTYIIEHDLLAHTRQVGAHLLDGLREIASIHDIFGDVLGVGLYTAMILRRDLRTGSAVPPNGSQWGRTLHVVGRRHGLLIRPYPSHILIAPPLTIAEAEVDDLLDRLDATLKETLSLVQPQLPAKHS